MAVRLTLIDDDGIQETLTTNSGDHGAVDVLQTLTELLAHCLRTFNHVLLLDQLESTYSDR